MTHTGMDGQVAVHQPGDGALGHLERGRRVIGAPDQVDGTTDGVELHLVGLVDRSDEDFSHEALRRPIVRRAESLAGRFHGVVGDQP